MRAERRPVVSYAAAVGDCKDTQREKIMELTVFRARGSYATQRARERSVSSALLSVACHAKCPSQRSRSLRRGRCTRGVRNRCPRRSHATPPCVACGGESRNAPWLATSITPQRRASLARIVASGSVNEVCRAPRFYAVRTERGAPKHKLGARTGGSLYAAWPRRPRARGPTRTARGSPSPDGFSKNSAPALASARDAPVRSTRRSRRVYPHCAA